MSKRNQRPNQGPNGRPNERPNQRPNCPVVAVVNRKGGAGKSTTTVQLGCALVRQGKRVLIVDLDDQAATSDLLLPGQTPERGTADVLLQQLRLIDVILSTPSGVDLCAASAELDGADLKLAQVPGREALLRTALAAVPANRWDVALLDCPPSLGLVSLNALVAASHVLVPCKPAYLDLRGLKLLHNTISRVREQLNPGLQVLGYLLCAVDEREGITQEARDKLRQHAGPLLWDIEVPVDARLKAGPGQTRRGRGVGAYESAAEELQRRLEMSAQMVDQTGAQMSAQMVDQTSAQTARSNP